MVAIVLGIASLFGPWWAATYRTSDGLPRTTSWGIFGVTSTGPAFPGAAVTTWTSDYRNLSAIGSIFGIAGTLFGLGLASAAAMTISLARPEPERESGESESEGRKGALGVLAFGFMASALLYVVVTLPLAPGLPFLAADQVGFWGIICSPTCGQTVTLGAGSAWYVALAASILLFGVGLVLWSDFAYLRDWHWLIWLSRNGWVLMVIFGPPAILFSLWSRTTTVAGVAGALAIIGFLAALLVHPAKIVWRCRTCGAVFYGADRTPIGAPNRRQESGTEPLPVGSFYAPGYGPVPSGFHAFDFPRQRCPACRSTHFQRATRAEVASARAAHEVYGDAPWTLKSR